MTASPGREHAAPSRILVLGGTSELALAILAALDAPPGTEVVLAGRGLHTGEDARCANSGKNGAYTAAASRTKLTGGDLSPPDPPPDR